MKTNFFALGDAGDIHSALWRLVVGLQRKHQVSSSATIEFKKFLFLRAILMMPFGDAGDLHSAIWRLVVGS